MDTINVLGIDLGTTNSAIAIWDPVAQKPQVLGNPKQGKPTPSVVAFDTGGNEPLVGAPARDLLASRPTDVVYSVKRFIGLSYREEQVRWSRDHVTYQIEEAAQQKVLIRAANRVLTPSAVSAEVLRRLKLDAEIALARAVSEVVITVPAYFNEAQRRATQEAGQKAGLQVRRLINEPTAACLAFDLGQEPQTVLVYDLGGGTFDVSVVAVKNGFYKVVATGGNTKLGGDDFDHAMVEWLKQAFEAQYSVPLAADKRQEAFLRTTLERAKIALSTTDAYQVDLPQLVATDNQRYDFTATLTSAAFTQLVQPLIDQTLAICERVVEMARQKTHGEISQSSIQRVLLVGAQTQTPAIRTNLQQRFGWPLNDSVDAGQAVALGAATLGGFLSNDANLVNRIRLWDVIAQPLGIEIAQEQRSSESKPGEQISAPTQGKMFFMIKANEQIPTTTEHSPQEFTAPRPGQDSIDFRIYQGDKPIAKENNWIGEVKLKLSDRPRDREKPRVKCWFEIDLDGILHVYAQEVGSPIREEKTFDYFYRVSQEEIAALTAQEAPENSASAATAEKGKSR